MLVPIAAIAAFIFIWLFMAAEEVSVYPPYELRIRAPQKQTQNMQIPLTDEGEIDYLAYEKAAQLSFTCEQATFIKSLPGVAYINDYPLIPAWQYLTRCSHAKGSAVLMTEDGDFMQTKVNSYGSLSDELKNGSPCLGADK